ncbi:unnamed protein product, partial [Urochloa humidicola]
HTHFSPPVSSASTPAPRTIPSFPFSLFYVSAAHPSLPVFHAAALARFCPPYLPRVARPLSFSVRSIAPESNRALAAARGSTLGARWRAAAATGSRARRRSRIGDEFKPASIDKTQAGSLQSTKDNRVTVEFQNNQPGKPKVTFEGSQEEYKDNDGVLFFDGETFRLERLHRAVKRLRHVRVPGETATTNLTTTTTGIVTESHSPPFAKVGKSQSISKPPVHSVPVEVERIDIGEPENSGPRYNNKSTTYQPVTTDPFALSPDPVDEDENLDILGDDDDNVSPNNMISGQGTSVRGFDINLPNQGNMDDEIADVDVNDEADEGLNAAEALRAQVNAEGQQEQGSSSSSGTSSSSSSGSGSGSGSSSSDSDGSDGDSASSGADVDI